VGFDASKRVHISDRNVLTVVPAKVKMVPCFNLARLRVVEAGTEMSCKVIAVQEAVAEATSA
jgi:hypothetical protein